MRGRSRISAGERVFRALLRLLPGDFRSDFSAAMAADAESMRATARWWTREIPGLAGAVVREHCVAFGYELRDARRQLLGTPGFTLTAILMLAVGTGVNAAMFSVIDAVIIRPSFPDPGRVVRLAEERPGRTPTAQVSLAALPALAGSPVFSAVAGVTGRVTMNERDGDVRRIDVDCVSSSLFDVLGVHPMMGRAFGPDEDRAGADPVIVISERMWQRDFLGRADVLGQTVTLGGSTSTIVGVMPKGFTGALSLNSTEAWAPLGPAVAGDRTAACGELGSTVLAVARIKPPATIASATAALNAARVLDTAPRAKGGNGRVALSRIDGAAYEEFQTPLAALMGTAFSVLLIACANVASFQLERAASRRREIAVRLALGASGWRIVRQMLVENVSLSLAGAAAGCGLAQLALKSIVSLMPPTLPHVADIAIDLRVLGAMAAFAIGAGMAVGLFPAASMLRAPAGTDLRASARGVAGGAQWTRRSLVIAEVAIAVTLLIGAGLMVRTLMALKTNDLGFDKSDRTIARLAFTGKVDGGMSVDEISRSLAGLRRLPGVSGVSASSYVPMRGYPSVNHVTAAGKESDVWSAAVSPEFLHDLGIPIARGRGFTPEDIPATMPVALVNESFGREFFPGADAVGETVAVREGAAITMRRLVGVIPDTRSGGRDTLGRSEIYVPLAQSGPPPMLYFLLKTDGPPDARLARMIRAVVAEHRPGQLVDIVESLDTTVDRAFARPRFAVWLFGAFGAIAALLAGLGLAAVMAWWVSQRRREIGVRVALGAPRAMVAGMVAREGLALTAAGIVIGLAFAYAGTRLLTEWLYGVPPNDPATFALCSAVMLIIAATTAYLPARRAARIDPAVTLRAE